MLLHKWFVYELILDDNEPKTNVWFVKKKQDKFCDPTNIVINFNAFILEILYFAQNNVVIIKNNWNIVLFTIINKGHANNEQHNFCYFKRDLNNLSV